NAKGRVVFGATVKLVDLDTDLEVRYQIVGDDEADIKAGRISISSPFARAIIGKLEGDEVGIQTPGGEKDYEVLLVEYI
ncbi:MAG: transcription elongation factor GreA, partial [Deltaproteobacteria bacterium]|nr:transcription elongation factor GreA [Deltaproteobacteria bacterium]